MNSVDICYIVDMLDNLRQNGYLLPLQTQVWNDICNHSGKSTGSAELMQPDPFIINPLFHEIVAATLEAG